jgi:hypothetical protein
MAEIVGSLPKLLSMIATRDFIRTMPAARIAAIFDGRAGADRDQGNSREQLAPP